ncbi:MAG: hypothetical protein JO159_08005 [Acidobacteria bacterium]|nr:hypothetical protein [Acidobacteriota bacterium]
MKKQALCTLSVLTLLVAAGSAFAQNVHVRANVPFDFIVDKTKLAAGQYEISTLNTGIDRTLLLSCDGKALRMINVNSVSSNQPSSETKLVFQRYGDRYFLSQIWVAGRDVGRELPRSAQEAEMALGYSPAKVYVLAELR